MGINNFVDNGLATLQSIHNAGIQTITQEKISIIEFFGKALKQSSIGAYNVFLKAELYGIIKKDEVNNTVNETSDKIAYLLGGYYLNTSTLLELKKELESRGINVKIIDERYYSKSTLMKMVKSLRKQMKNNEGKDIVLFGYSAGGMVAHKIGEKTGYKSVSFGMSENPNKTMVGTLISLTQDKPIESFKIPKDGINVIETFSGMVPNIPNNDNKTIQLKNTYSHMSIGNEEVVDELVKQILISFKEE